MECVICGRFAPPDPETGYDVDGICPGCASNGWTEIQGSGGAMRVIKVQIDAPEVVGGDDDGETKCPF